MLFACLYKYLVFALFWPANFNEASFLSIVNKCTITIVIIIAINVKSVWERYFAGLQLTLLS